MQELIQFELQGEGELSETLTVPIPSPPLAPAVTSGGGSTVTQMDFRAADPMCLPAEMQAFDCVVLNDVLDRVSSPNAVLGRLGGVRGLVRPGGMLAVRSGFQWREETTPRSLWLGGYRADFETATTDVAAPTSVGLGLGQGQAVHSQQELERRLGNMGFKLVRREQLPVCWPTAQGELRASMHHLSFFKRQQEE